MNSREISSTRRAGQARIGAWQLPMCSTSPRAMCETEEPGRAIFGRRPGSTEIRGSPCGSHESGMAAVASSPTRVPKRRTKRGGLGGSAK